VSGEALPILNKVFLTLNLGWCPLNIWGFVADITNEFILGLDILCAYDASVDIGRQTLRIWCPGAGPRPSSLVVANDQVIPARCEGIVIARFEILLGVENGLVEPSPQVHLPEGIYVARTLVQARQEVPVRVLNATHSEQKLTRGFPLAHCEPVMLVTLPDVGQPQVQDSRSKLEDVITVAKPHLTNREFWELENS
jgi:hypothetical protein